VLLNYTRTIMLLHTHSCASATSPTVSQRCKGRLNPCHQMGYMHPTGRTANATQWINTQLMIHWCLQLIGRTPQRWVWGCLVSCFDGGVAQPSLDCRRKRVRSVRR
jgi:hypothetical protein